MFSLTHRSGISKILSRLVKKCADALILDRVPSQRMQTSSSCRTTTWSILVKTLPVFIVVVVVIIMIIRIIIIIIIIITIVIVVVVVVIIIIIYYDYDYG